MTSRTFPITLRCDRMKGWPLTRDFQPAFDKARPKNHTYYGYDVVILDPTHVQFITYEMEDFYHGGVGREKHRYLAEVPAALTRGFIERKLMQMAQEKRTAELKAQEEAIVKSYFDTLCAEFDATQAPPPPSPAVSEDTL